MRLYAFYDLEVSPATWDIVKFLVLAEKRRIEYRCDDLTTVIVPASNGFRKGDLEIYQRYGNYDEGYMRWRLRNILVPCCWLVNSSVMLCGDREEAQRIIMGMDGMLFPDLYTVIKPTGRFLDWYMQHEEGEIPSLRATPQSLVYVNNWLKERAEGRKVVTINLRETAYEPERNSNIEEWSRFSYWLDKSKYMPLMLRDMEKAYELNGFATYPEIIWNVELRQALYELSYLNLFVTGGPSCPALYDKKANTLVFKMLSPNCGATSEQFLKGQGLEIGGQWKNVTPNHKIIWDEDKFEVIKLAFCEMCEQIGG